MHRPDMYRAGWIFFQLRPQTGDMVVHCSADRVRLVSPDFVQQFLACHNLAGPGDKYPQRREFLTRAINSLSENGFVT